MGAVLKVKINNLQAWELHKAEIEKLLADGKTINLVYEPASKEHTKKQVGFFFGALCDQICRYMNECGFNVNTNDVKYGLYYQVKQIVPEMVIDSTLFGKEERTLHISDMDRPTMSKFIDGVFTVIDTNPMYAGLKLTPDVRYNWVNTITTDDLIFTRPLPERDNHYLDYIREQPCIICGQQHRSHAHHIRDTRTAGQAIKSPDWYTVPLCPQCHMNVAHGTGFKDTMKWIPIDLMDFCRLCYSRWKNKN